MTKIEGGNILTLGLGALIFLCSTVCFADFTVHSPYQSAEPYGNAETIAFKRSLSGEGGSLSQEEQDALLAYLPEKDYNRYYARVRLNAGRLYYNKIRSDNTFTQSLGTVQNTGTGSSQVGIELALGYAFDPNFRMDLEFLGNKTLNYQAAPAFAPPTLGAISGSFKSTVLLGNLFFDITGFDTIKPYFFGSLGIASTRSQSSLTGVPGFNGQHTFDKVSFAVGLGVGVRFAVFQRWYFDMGFRAIQFDNATKLSPNTAIQLKGNYGMMAFSMGLIYFF